MLSINWLKLFFGIGIFKIFLEKNQLVYSSALEFVEYPSATTVGSLSVLVDLLRGGVCIFCCV